MKPNVYIYILVMAGVTYLIRMLPLVLFKKRDHQFLCKIFLILCAVCLSCGDDISGDPYRNSRQHYFRCRRTDRGADCSLS